LGEHDSLVVKANVGRFGPYIQHEKVAYMKNLLLVSGAFTTSLLPPILKLDKLVANFADNFTKIDNLYS
jgi:hypothetical protein